jgi:hypothetical protein
VADEEGREFFMSLENFQEIITLTPEENQEWAEKTRPVLDEYVAKTAKEGLPGKQFLDDLLEAIEK